MSLWERRHHLCFWIGVVFSVAIIALSVCLWWYFEDSGFFGLLSALALPVILLTVGGKVFSSNAKSKARQALLEDYHEKLRKLK